MGEVPFIPFWNNVTHTPDLPLYKDLIDAYDKVYSGFHNDIDDVQEVIFVIKNYAILLHTIDEELSKFYARYAANESISLDKARRLLSRAELENFRMSLEEFIEKARADGYDKELNEIYLRSQVSRLQALQTQIEMRIRELYQSQRDLLHTSLAQTLKDTYYRSIFNIQQGIGFLTNFARLDTETIEGNRGKGI